jgi:NAD(P)H-dependent FMN reductase
MTRILGIAGSLRRQSLNRALLQAAAELAPEGVEIEIASIAGIPLYDGDLEESAGVPQAAVALREKIAAADGLLLASPEYNNSLPGVLKNAIDWTSRPGKEIPRVFGGRPVAVIGVTPGPGGTRLAQTAWLPVFRVLGMRPWFDRTLYVAGGDDFFDDDLKLVDPEMQKRLAAYVRGFAAFVAGD